MWTPLTYSQVLSIIHNPRYAGAYYYGRQRSRKQPDGSTFYYSVPREEWLACIPNAHPGYISWQQYQDHLQTLHACGRAHGPDRRRHAD